MTDPWKAIGAEIEKHQQALCPNREAVEKCRDELAARVNRPIDLKHCTQTAQGWLRVKSSMSEDGLVVVRFIHASPTDSWGRPVLPLEDMQSARAAILGVNVEAKRHKSKYELRAYNVGLEVTGANPLYVRVDLDLVNKGHGPCAHPLLHAHAGSTETASEDVRVPLPWLTPWEALDWVQSISPGARDQRP